MHKDVVQCFPADRTAALFYFLCSDPVMELLQLAPVIDGDFIPDQPSKRFHNAAQFDYLAGVNSMDGHIFAGFDVPLINSRIFKITA